MSRRLIGRSAILSLACAGLLGGCYPYPPPAAGYPPPGAYGAGGPGPQAEGGYGPGGYGPGGYEAGPPPGAAMPGEAAPGGYGPSGYGPSGYAPGSYAPGGPAAAARLVTREQFIRRAERRAARTNQDPQRAAQRASRQFDQIDVNHAGVVSQEQIREWRAAHRYAPNQPPPQPNQPPLQPG